MVMGSRAGITSVCCKGLRRLTAIDDSARIVFTPHTGSPSNGHATWRFG